jgi:general secretion pathway protein E/type IV pilus assembly protein PilB
MVSLSNIDIEAELLQVISPEQAWQYWVVPKAISNNFIEFYTDRHITGDAVAEELEVFFAKQIVFKQVTTDQIKRLLGKHYRKPTVREVSFKHSGERGEDFLPSIIFEANANGSSDIHFEAFEERCRIRMRIDGKLIERYVIEKADYPALINKIKIQARLDIAEKRLPQDGRILFNNNNNSFDIRVSVLPTLHGEKVVLRLLSKDTTDIDIAKLGLTDTQLEIFRESMLSQHGIVLVSGPTGSGKTTTLYATLKILNRLDTNILTIEDPIEYTLKGINQVQLKEDIGLTFASALRTFLRQDPDIIMLGEIRDVETAQMAIRASLTGHLVLSTIHTNSAWGIISRLVDMGIPPFLLASTINLLVAQRLVRLLCPSCKAKRKATPNQFPAGYKIPANTQFHYVAVGCEECYYTGYKGRKAVYEILAIDHEMRQIIKNGTKDIKVFFQKKKIFTLADAAQELFAAGQTSFEEVYSILKTDTSD